MHPVKLIKSLSDKRHDAFWRHNTIFFVGSMAIAALNYIYYPILSRIMTVQYFGELQLLLSLLNQTAIIVSAFNLVIIVTSGARHERSALIIEHLHRLALLIMALLMVILLAASPILQHFFKFGSVWPFVILGLSLIITVPLSFGTAFLQGRKRFYETSLAGSVQALFKIVLSVILVTVGFKTLGAIAGIVLAQIIAFLYVRRVASKFGYSERHWLRDPLPDWSVIKPELPFILAAAVMTIVTTMLYTGDIVAVKRFFSPDVAGQYAGITTVARIMFFATASISGVLIASVSHSAEPGENWHILRRSLKLVCGIGLPILIIFGLFPRLLVTILVGSRYGVLAHLLPLATVITFLSSVINLLFVYLLALRRLVVLPIALIGGLTTLILVLIRHATVTQVLQSFLAGCVVTLALLIFLGVYYERTLRKVKL